ncbi:MAG: hypothetical protein HOQ32_15140 [Lysobacter sp.]|nr:hypothetical protein [Lysobacter sp.]
MKKAILVVALTAAALGAVWWLTEPKTGAPKDTALPDVPAQPQTATGESAPQSAGAASSLLWRNTTSGDNLVWRFADKGAVAPVALWAVGADWHALAHVPAGWSGSDLVAWRNPADGEIRLWKLGAGAADPTVELLPPAGPEWGVAAFVDANADGNADVVWTSKTGGVALWLLRDGKVTEQAIVGDTGGDWTLAQVGDFDGDGRGDLFWRKNDGSSASIWSLDGGKLKTSRGLADPGSAWTLLAVGKFDGEPGDDLLWKDQAGNLLAWSGGDAAKPISFARQSTADWQFVAAVDVDGNGRTDLIWRNPSTTQTGAWLFGASGEITDLSLSPVGAEWSPVSSALVAQVGR